MRAVWERLFVLGLGNIQPLAGILYPSMLKAASSGNEGPTSQDLCSHHPGSGLIVTIEPPFEVIFTFGGLICGR